TISCNHGNRFFSSCFPHVLEKNENDLSIGMQEKVERVAQETKEFLEAFSKNYVQSVVLDQLRSSVQKAVAAAMEEKAPGDEGTDEKDASASKTDNKTTDANNANDSKSNEVIGAALIGHTTMKAADNSDYTCYQVVGCKVGSDAQLQEDNIPVSQLTIKYTRYSKLLAFYTSLVQQLKQSNVDTSKFIFPKKKFFGRLDPEFVQGREAALKVLFEEVNKNKAATQTSVFQEFFGFQKEEEDDQATFLDALIATCQDMKWSIPSTSELLKFEDEEDKLQLALMHRFRGPYHDLSALSGTAQKAYHIAVGKIVAPQASVTWKSVTVVEKSIQKKLDDLTKNPKLEESLTTIVTKILSIPLVKEKLLAKKSDENNPGIGYYLFDGIVCVWGGGTERKENDNTLDLEKVNAWSDFWNGWGKQPVAELAQALDKKKIMDTHGKPQWEDLFKYDLAEELKHFHAFDEIVSRHEHSTRSANSKAMGPKQQQQKKMGLLNFLFFLLQKDEKEAEPFLQKTGLELAKNIDSLKTEVENHSDHLSTSSAVTLTDLAPVVAGYIADLISGVLFNEDCKDKKEYAKQLLTQMISALLQTVEDTTISDASEIIQGELQESLTDVQGLASDLLPEDIASNLTGFPLKVLNYIVNYQVKKTVKSQRQLSEKKLIQRILES
ncbi:hypothetical protein RFI_23894, partial [Reticulomyxa filosa]